MFFCKDGSDPVTPWDKDMDAAARARAEQQRSLQDLIDKGNARGIPPLGYLTLDPATKMSPQEADALAEYWRKQVAAIHSVPTTVLGEGSGITYQNMEQKRAEDQAAIDRAFQKTRDDMTRAMEVEIDRKIIFGDDKPATPQGIISQVPSQFPLTKTFSQTLPNVQKERHDRIKKALGIGSSAFVRKVKPDDAVPCPPPKKRPKKMKRPNFNTNANKENEEQ
jgi:hypothetical protein